MRSHLSMPPGNVHDLRYLYAVIATLYRLGRRIESGRRALDHFGKAINDYNDAKASRYGLSFKPRAVNAKVVKNVTSELNDLKIIGTEETHLALTNAGERIAVLIEERDSDGLKKAFLILMLESYSIFETFLKRLKEISDGNGVPVPYINAEVFDRYDEDPVRIANAYAAMLLETCPNLSLDPRDLSRIFEGEQRAWRGLRTQKLKSVQTILEKYIIAKAFSPDINSRRTYDFVRTRMSFLELTNYAALDFGGLPAEVTYLISDFDQTYTHSAKMLEYKGGRIYISHPSFEEILKTLKASVLSAYNRQKDDFGYAKIADVRDAVCRDQRISDYVFDSYLKRVYREDPSWLSFTYAGAGDIITEKRLPIVFGTPIRELFTMLKVNEGR